MAVLVYTENWDGKFKKSTFELASYATRLAEKIPDQVVALSIGHVEEEELKKLGRYGIGKVISVEDDRFKTLDNQVYTRIIAEVAENLTASVVVLAHNNSGKALAPRLSVRMKAGLVSGTTGLPESFEPFIVIKKTFTGKALAKVVIHTAKKILTLAQNSYQVVEQVVPVEIRKFVPVSAGDVKTVVKEVFKQTGKVILTDADIVVSGGRGMKSPENWGPIEELAKILGAATACSRPVSDEGWRPHEEHTGQTGKVIAPVLYFAFGISGAIQHVAGISSSKFIVAVNTDKDAPIFEVADYGIVGDAQKVLPALIEAIKEAKSI
ncbi:MAG: electron transfer flavoprotein subunit alpha [Bacteroidetes bacterium GWF2_49_14]|nr:MAG: electron transfer flavoprotein subunit alpha [Bacteroidetes bacterium GWF2_49_14]HBB90556.1 electron transfer flavoprotein subunit alpha [Bacteroidales bacterium]